MILYKTIILQYGRYLKTRQPEKTEDAVGHMVPTEETRAQRQGIFDDLAAARLYLLDHRAANYLDSLRMDAQGMPWEEKSKANIQNYVQEIDFPQDLVWIEFDSRNLWEARIARGLTAMDKENMKDWHQRGFLFDNRSQDVMTVRLFSALNNKRFLDPPLTLVLTKSNDGRLCFDNTRWEPQNDVIWTRMQQISGNPERQIKDHLETYKGHLSYEMVIGFMLFAALSAREDDLRSREVPSLSTAEMKTARKFGKTWITESFRSHVTVQIGPVGERHLTEYAERRQFENAQASGRAAPTEHWVSKHERRYANGKVVQVKAHKRGRHADRNLPIRVVGPRT